ncbi:MAG TPA: PAS domain S-box protein, partial [Ignavibacteriaceae bacterium]
MSYNKQAVKLFNIKEKAGNIFDYFERDSAVELSKLIEDVLSARKAFVKNLILTFTNGINLKCQATINPYQSLLFCTFIQEEHNLRINEITKLKVKRDELAALISNNKIEKIIDSIKELFPFTVLGKEKIRHEIDQFEELLWVKNEKGIIILVNRQFAQSFGLTSAQLEGRAEEELLPGYLRAVYQALENYIKDSNNVIALEGIPFQGLSALNNYQTIEIPLNDSDGSIAAIIGISQKAEKSSPVDSVERPENFLENVPAAVAILDNTGTIKHSSKEFCKLFSDEFSDLRNLSYTNVFPLEISEKVKKFLDSPTEDAQFLVKLSKAGEWKDRELNVLFRKNIGESGKPAGLSVYFEDATPDADLERFITKRGKMYEILIQNNPEPIFIYDKENLNFLEVNQAALNLYGYRRDEFLKMDLTDLYTPEDIQTLLDSSSGGGKEGVFTGPYQHKRKNGESVFVEISKTSFRFNNKDAHFNVVKDVTGNLITNREVQLYKAAFDNASNLIIITDSSGFIKSLNTVAANQLGYSNKDLLDAVFASLVNDEDRGLINSKIFQAHTMERVTISTQLKKADGKTLKAEVLANPVLNYKNEVDSYILIIKPETEASDKTDQRVKEIIVEKIVEKESTTTDKIDPAVLSGIFHEILTPINAMLGFVQELTESIDQSTPEQKEAKEIIDLNRRRLLSTMNSVIEYSRMEQEPVQLDIKEVSITEIVDETQEEISDILRNKGIEFAYGKISSSLSFKTDSQKFVSLIVLLFKISSQFTSTKKIYFSAYQTDDNNFIISIQDNYSSMSPSFSENFNNIFNKRGLKKDYGLSKLSINLACRLIDLLQGKFVDKSKKIPGFIFPLELVSPELLTGIKAADDEETGTEKLSGLGQHEPEISAADEVKSKQKTVESSVQPEKELTAGELEEPDDETQVIKQFRQRRKTSEHVPVKDQTINRNKIDLSQLSCLYIEDQVDSQILFKVQLKELNKLKFAVSFEEALPLLDSHEFDFIVLDINLQGEYNGLDALKIIHRMPGYESIPIIAVTAYVLPGDR